MRLTLRTLLAYLDDTLDPSQTKAIGQQVSESAVAQELIARIKEVVRKRRLATPPVSGPDAKLDANTIAEFIDNVLPPDRQTEVEELCLHIYKQRKKINLASERQAHRPFVSVDRNS